jgi:hypothetical protein
VKTGRPVIPYGCRSCDERRPSKFSAGYKTLCSACRATLMRERRELETGRPSLGPRPRPKTVKPHEPRPKKRVRKAAWFDIIAPGAT